MPYIASQYRDAAMNMPTDAGRLNYAITVRSIQLVEGEVYASEFGTQIMMLVENYIEIVGWNYRSFNDVMGVLACVPLEMERRLNKDFTNRIRFERLKLELDAFSTLFYALTVGPYEDGRMESNGDVFPSNMVAPTEEAV